MIRFGTASAAALLVASAVQAAPVLDGTLTAADGYGAPVMTYTNFFNGTDATGGTNVVSTYFTYDADYVYGAVKLDSGLAQYAGANIYVYSGSLNHSNVTGQPGVYGDGNDAILEGTNGLRLALAEDPYATPAVPYTAATANYVTNDTDTVEFSISRSLLGDYDSFRFGGQLFSYEFHTGGDRVDGAIVSVTPEPAALALIGVAGAGLLLRRRRVVP